MLTFTANPHHRLVYERFSLLSLLLLAGRSEYLNSTWIKMTDPIAEPLSLLWLVGSYSFWVESMACQGCDPSGFRKG